MEKNRLEAFSDGVIAIIITIMVLELKQPVGDKLGNLLELSPVLLGYALSFLFVAIYPEKLNKISLVIPMGLMLTVLIETVQMILQMGQCDLEDLVANALGALVGLIAYRQYKKIHL